MWYTCKKGGKIVNNPSPPKLSEVRLNSSERKLLKYLKRNKVVSREKAYEVLKKYDNKSACITLCIKGLAMEKDGIIKLIMRGENYIEFSREDRLHKHLPLAFSAISILISIIALICSLLK